MLRVLLLRSYVLARLFALSGPTGAIVFGSMSIACDRNETPEPSRTATPTGAAPSESNAAPSTQGSSSANAATSAAAPSKLAGRWSGDYDAKKARISLDKGVKDKAWADDDGKAASGKGEIEIVVAEDGTVTGRVSGPLGPGRLAGQAEDDRITASLSPEESTSDAAMDGTLVLEPSGADWKGTLRASSGHGEIAREAEVRVSRGK